MPLRGGRCGFLYLTRLGMSICLITLLRTDEARPFKADVALVYPYLDANGAKTGLSTQTAADVPVATGAIHDSTTLADLYKLACLLQEEPAWDALIEQIVVYPDGEWLLVPRVGDFDVHFGRPVNMETKLKRLAVFMSEYLPKMGWETYSSINLKYDNQIVCTRKKT